jgi:C8 domain
MQIFDTVIFPCDRSCLMDSCDCPQNWKQCACQVFTAFGRDCQQAGARVILPPSDDDNYDKSLAAAAGPTSVIFRWPCAANASDRRRVAADGRQHNNNNNNNNRSPRPSNRQQQRNDVLLHLTRIAKNRGRLKEDEAVDEDPDTEELDDDV